MMPDPEMNAERSRIFAASDAQDEKQRTTILDVRHLHPQNNDILLDILSQLKEITFLLQRIEFRTRP